MLAFESASFSNFSLILSLLDCSWDSRMISKSFLWGSFICTSQNNPLFFGRVRIHEIPLNHSLPWATLCVPLKILSDLWSKTKLWWSWAAYFYSPLLLPHLLKYAVVFFLKVALALVLIFSLSDSVYCFCPVETLLVFSFLLFYFFPFVWLLIVILLHD